MTFSVYRKIGAGIALMMFFSTYSSSAPNLKLPFPPGIGWNVTRAYNYGTHVGKDAYALDFNLDACQAWGQPALAVAPGIAYVNGSANSTVGYGLYIDINHGDGYISRYGHLSSVSIQTGEWVRQGQEIGKIGNSGYFESSATCDHPGAHLHLAMYHNNFAYKQESMDAVSSFVVGGKYFSTNIDPWKTSEYLQIDAFCKQFYANPLVERFRDQNSGQILVNMTPVDGKVYYYADMACHLNYSLVYYAGYDAGGIESLNFPLMTQPLSSEPQPIVGSRTDLEPDFDVKDETDQKELSSNCNNCSTKPLIPGQKIIAKLKTEISNDNASEFKRDSSSKSIEGYVWWKIEGKTDNWSLLTNSMEYTISDLVNGSDKDENIESYTFIVPNYVGDILAMKACVDGDDEIYEEGEGARVKITNPDQSGTSNNCSRTERFFIVPPTVVTPQPVHCEPPTVNDPTDNQKCITPQPSVANIIPIITDLLLADPELTVVVQGNGIVTSTPAGIKCPGVCTEGFSGQKVTLIATPKKGSVFVGWSDGCSQSKKKNACKLDMTEDRAMTATFKKKP